MERIVLLVWSTACVFDEFKCICGKVLLKVFKMYLRQNCSASQGPSVMIMNCTSTQHRSSMQRSRPAGKPPLPLCFVSALKARPCSGSSLGPQRLESRCPVHVCWLCSTKNFYSVKDPCKPIVLFLCLLIPSADIRVYPQTGCFVLTLSIAVQKEESRSHSTARQRTDGLPYLGRKASVEGCIW